MLQLVLAVVVSFLNQQSSSLGFHVATVLQVHVNLKKDSDFSPKYLYPPLTVSTYKGY